MSTQRLRDALREHYEERGLDDDRLARLRAMAAVESPAQFPEPPLMEGWESTAPPAASDVKAWTRRPWLPVLAAAVLVAVLLPWLNGTSDQASDIQRRSAAVAEEIAMNHSKGLDVEFATADLATLRRQMHKLDFSLLEARRLEGRAWTLVGGRYCSIQGRLAAQLKLRTADGDAVTLYQTQLVDDLAEISDRRLQNRGLNIELWHEGGVFFGLARAP